MKDIVIVGASGFGRELAQYVVDIGGRQPDVRLKGFLDDDPCKKEESTLDLGGGVLGDTHSYQIREGDRFLVAPGDPELRKLLADRLVGRGARFFTLVHPSAYVAPTATLGEGCVVGPFASVGSYARLGDHVLLNLYACAGHDTQIGAYSVVSPYGVANGGSIIGECVFFGTHAVVTPTKKVGRQSRIAAGAVVYRDVPERSLATGNPAKTFALGQQSDA